MSSTDSIHAIAKEEVSSASSNHGKQPLNIIVIGGSSAGLIAGILMKRHGHNVHILESARSDERQGLAAGIGLQSYIKKFFDEYDRLKDVPLGVPNDSLSFIDQNLNLQRVIPISLHMTSWDAVYYRLRANFDQFASPYDPNPPAPDAMEGQGVFETGKRVVHVEDAGNRVRLEVEDAATQTHKPYEADIVIAADGANSSIRRQMEPNLHRHEPGYVLWRGTIPTKDLSREFLDRFEMKTWFCVTPYSYAIMYTIPGTSGSLADNEREINFAWYHWTTPTRTREILTDTVGHVHRTTLPKGSMRPEIWHAQLEIAKRTFHPEFHHLLTKISQPFVTVISTIVSPRASFLNDKLFLVGDALAQKQPNSAMGGTMAAKNAYDLLEVVEGRMTAAEWEQISVAEGEAEAARSASFGCWYLHTVFGWAWYTLRYKFIVWRQTLFQRLFGRAVFGLRNGQKRGDVTHNVTKKL